MVAFILTEARVLRHFLHKGVNSVVLVTRCDGFLRPVLQLLLEVLAEVVDVILMLCVLLGVDPFVKK